MDIKAVSSTFPSDIDELIKEVLKHTDDPVVVRDKLKSLKPDQWIVVRGKAFAYLVSRANKSAGLFENKTKGVKYLVYTPPYHEMTPYIKDPPTSTGKWNITLIKLTPQSNETSQKIFRFLSTIDYQDHSKSCEVIKMYCNSLEERFWHVFVGVDFTCVLPSSEVEYLIYAKANKGEAMLDVVIFRQQGVQKKINWVGFGEGLVYLFLTLTFFLGVFGSLKCTEQSESWLCRYYWNFLYIGFAFMLSKITKMITSRVKKT